MTGIRGTLAERFHAKYIPEPMSGCWLWEASIGKYGYGWIYAPPRNMVRAHRVSYELHKGPTHGFVVRHTCDNPCCVNPDHLILGTQKENVEDREARQRRAPPKGDMNGRATLTEVQVLAIRADPRKRRFIAAEYDVAPRLIGRIKSRETWGHLP